MVIVTNSEIIKYNLCVEGWTNSEKKNLASRVLEEYATKLDATHQETGAVEISGEQFYGVSNENIVGLAIKQLVDGNPAEKSGYQTVVTQNNDLIETSAVFKQIADHIVTHTTKTPCAGMDNKTSTMGCLLVLMDTLPTTVPMDYENIGKEARSNLNTWYKNTLGDAESTLKNRDLAKGFVKRNCIRSLREKKKITHSIEKHFEAYMTNFFFLNSENNNVKFFN